MGSSVLVRQPVLEKENPEFRLVELHLKIDFVSHPARTLVYVYIYIYIDAFEVLWLLSEKMNATSSIQNIQNEAVHITH